MRLIDMTGQRFGRATVIAKGTVRKNGGSNWVCLCDCGIEFVAIGSNLRKGHTKSCGCLAAEWSKHLGSNKDFIKIRSQKMITHGHKRRNAVTPEYKTWLGMKRRCYDVKCKDYPNWGGRGIRVCDRWLHSFESFLADMGPKPAGYTIDRLDPNKDYRPENCRWATLEQQGGEHKRTNKPVTVNGNAFASYSEACRFFGVSPTVANMRMKSGISPEIAVSHKERLKPRRSKESYLPKSKRR